MPDLPFMEPVVECAQEREAIPNERKEDPIALFEQKTPQQPDSK